MRAQAGHRLEALKETMTHFVYSIQSVNQPEHYYIGMTNDFERRIEEHNSGITPHTNKFRPWKAVVVVQFWEKDKAVSFERYLKSGSGRAFSKKHF